LTLPERPDLLRAFQIPTDSSMRLPGCALLLPAILLTAGCGTRDPRFSDETIYMGGYRRTAQPQRANFDNVSYWDGDSVAGSPTIKISLGEQKAYFYKAGELVGVSIISTGREGFNTPTGSYRILQKNRDHKSSLYGNYVDRHGNIIQKDIDRTKDPKPPGAIYDGANMPYFMRFTGGIGMHEGFLPGYPASHGCIRMPGFMAEKFFANVSQGTPVEVVH
jgi:lipoprotein-anchoring transpeptidase ErfK/SrfK